MAKKRTRIEIVKDVLDVLVKNKNVKVTHLIYKANLSNNSLKEILKDLLENQLVEPIINKDKTTYKITKKGIEFLEEYNKMKIFSDAYGL